MSATTRLLLGFLFLLAIGFYLLLAQLSERVRRQYLEAAEEPMVDSAQLFAAMIEQHLDTNGTLDLTMIRSAFSAAQKREFRARIYNLIKTSLSTNIYVTDRLGTVIFDSDGGRAEGQDYSDRRDVLLTMTGRYGARSTRANPRDETGSVMFVAAPIRHANEIVGVVSVSKPVRSMQLFVNETRARIRWLGGTFFLAIALGAVLLTEFFARPIRRLTDYVRAITRGQRMPAPRTSLPEVAALGHAFEEMRDALEDRKYVERYVQTLTHEMKSPVAAIRGAAELLREEMPQSQREKFLGNIDAETSRLQKIIERLLALAAIESRKSLDQPERLSLVDLAGAVCAQMQPGVEAGALKIELTVHADQQIVGERFLLEIALTNLLQNAIDFSPSGGVIHIEIEDGKIIVTDEGPGIPDYALPRVFERFYSLQHPATGHKSSGLGLCFVREAAQLHGGTVAITNRTDRTGVRAVIILPLNVSSHKTDVNPVAAT